MHQWQIVLEVARNEPLHQLTLLRYRPGQNGRMTTPHNLREKRGDLRKRLWPHGLECLWPSKEALCRRTFRKDDLMPVKEHMVIRHRSGLIIHTNPRQTDQLMRRDQHLCAPKHAHGDLGA